MANRKRAIPQYGTVTLNGLDYYRTRVQDADGKLVALYARTPEELYDKELNALEQIDNDTFCRKSPTVAEYCEKWLLMQSVHVRATTMTDYTSKVRRHIIKELGDMRMADVTLDDIQLALVPVSKKSASVYKSVVVLYKYIFRAAKESRIIENNPTVYLTSKGGGVPQKEKEALTDEQAARLLDAIQGLPPYVFVMLGLYAGLRREEILALQWDSVYLDTDTPYLTVRRAWHTESNRPVILDELKTKAAERNIPLPICLADCLREAKANSTSEYVVPNRDGDPLSYTQFKRLWQYIVTRTTKERVYYRYEDGKRVQHTVTPVLGEKAAHNGKVVYSLDFEVTPHQLRHPYVKHMTKIFSLRLMDSQAQAYPDAQRKTRGACQLHRGGQSRSPVRPLYNRKRFSCLPPQSKMSWILYAISMRLSGYTSTRSISISASSVVSASASKIALDASFRLSCRACSSCFCFACANTAA